MVACGADVRARDSTRRGWTALHYAATGADPVFIGCDDLVQARTVRKLVELGADVNVSNDKGWTPMHAAATRGHTCTVIRLAALGAHVRAQDYHGRCPLHMAARWGWSSTVEALLTLGGFGAWGVGYVWGVWVCKGRGVSSCARCTFEPEPRTPNPETRACTRTRARVRVCMNACILVPACQQRLRRGLKCFTCCNGQAGADPHARDADGLLAADHAVGVPGFPV